LEESLCNLLLLTLVFGLRVKTQIPADRATAMLSRRLLVEGVAFEPLTDAGARWLGAAPLHHRVVVSLEESCCEDSGDGLAGSGTRPMLISSAEEEDIKPGSIFLYVLPIVVFLCCL
jgi:hypothetical protein